MFDLKEHLKTLVEAHAPSGHEGPIREIVRESWSNLVDTFEEDGLGSLIGIKNPTRAIDPPRKIMLAAHMDEIGLMVRDVVDGFIYVRNVGGMDARVMMAQPVLVHGKRPLKGYVATMPPHLLTEEARKKYPTIEHLVIDVGLPADEVAELVTIGDLVTPDTPMLALQNNQFAAKAYDDRACVAAVTACLNELQSMQHGWHVYATATVQEEVGLYGATTAAHKINPDIAIALDVTFGKQDGVPADAESTVGGGPSLALGPNIHPKLFDKLVETAKTYEIKYQLDPATGNTGTDAWAIQVAQHGIPTVLISVPLRNMHSPVETLDLQDIARAGRLMAHFIAALDDDFLQAIVLDNPVAETEPTN